MINLTQVKSAACKANFPTNNSRSVNTVPYKPISIRDKGLGLLDSKAIVSTSVRLPNGGWVSASVFKHESHMPDNPVFLVRGTDVNGDQFEMVVDVNKVDPKNAHFIELMALDGYFMTKGQPLGLTRNAVGALNAGLGVYDIFTRFNSLPPLQEMMVFQRANGNLSGYIQYKNIIDSIIDFMALRH